MEFVYPVNKLHTFSDTHLQSKSIPQYFADTTVFVTGATGFLGKLLVEKLLRSCPDIKRIYILMRPKKDKTPEQRFKEYFDNVVFSRLKNEFQKALEKVFILLGDCEQESIGLTIQDQHILFSEVNCIFHVAATVRFDEKVRKATYINVRGTKEILRLARQIKSLTSFVYVSTAFSFCPRDEIDEIFYEPLVTPEQLITLVDIFDDEKLEELTPTLLGKWPNTYVFTKSVAENVIKQEIANLPLAVVRPSIVIATYKEPLPGWIDNFYGVTGVVAGTGLGLIRAIQCNPNCVADLVPADFVVNTFIAAAWEVANKKELYINSEVSKINGISTLENTNCIYNYVSGPQSPITWQQNMSLGFKYGQNNSSVKQVWHYFIVLAPNFYVYTILHWLLHLVPAYTVDTLAYCIGKRPRLSDNYKRISKFLDVIALFATHEWNFKNFNTQMLWKKMSSSDRESFCFDLSCFDWETYFESYLPGIRMYLMDDPLDTLSQGRAKAFKLKIAHYFLVGLILYGIFMLLLRLVY